MFLFEPAISAHSNSHDPEDFPLFSEAYWRGQVFPKVGLFEFGDVLLSLVDCICPHHLEKELV